MDRGHQKEPKQASREINGPIDQANFLKLSLLPFSQSVLASNHRGISPHLVPDTTSTYHTSNLKDTAERFFNLVAHHLTLAAIRRQCKPGPQGHQTPREHEI